MNETVEWLAAAMQAELTLQNAAEDGDLHVGQTEAPDERGICVEGWVDLRALARAVLRAQGEQAASDECTIADLHQRLADAEAIAHDVMNMLSDERRAGLTVEDIDLAISGLDYSLSYYPLLPEAEAAHHALTEKLTALRARKAE